MKLDHDFLERLEAYGPIARNLGQLIRPTIIARPGRVKVWGDWSAIEARVLPWLADSTDAERVLNIFRRNDKDKSLPDIYRIEAGNIFGKPPEEVDGGEERQTGKVAVLALGFGGGVGALAAMAAAYGLYLDDAMKKFIVEMWRENNPWARRFWGSHGRDGSYGLWGAMNSAIEDPDTPYGAGRVAYVYDKSYLGGTLFCALPSTRVLTYPSIKWEWREVEDKNTGKVEDKYQLTFLKQYGRSAMWYGKAAENVTQATAGDVLRGTLKKLRRDPELRDFMPVTGHTHDEILTEPKECDGDEAKDVLKEVMEEGFEWSTGLPLVAEVTKNWYYSKAVK